MTDKYENLNQRAVELGALEAKTMSTSDIVFDPRSHLKCRFGCQRWGHFWTCPPHLGMSFEQFKEAFDRYGHALVIKTADPQMGQKVAVAMEKEAMVLLEDPFPFALALCVQCEECAYPEPCRFPHLARPTMDAFAMDIGATVEKAGFSLDFDPDGKLLPAWYSMVLLQ